MEVLTKGNYVGHVHTTMQWDGIIAGTTIYNDESLNGDLHSHENPHISFILKGGSIDKRERSEKEQRAGTIAFYHAGEAHQTIQKMFPAQHVNLELDTEFLKRYNLYENDILNCIKKTPDAKFLLIKIYHEFLLNDKYSKTSIDLMLLELLNAGCYKEKHFPTWAIQLEELLRANWNETIELRCLSQMLGVHPVTISKNFNRYFGCCFGDYMRKLKIEQAIMLIKNNKQSLTEITYSCGFADQSHFIRTFKAFTGMLPLQFRKL